VAAGCRTSHVMFEPPRGALPDLPDELRPRYVTLGQEALRKRKEHRARC
jgi:hypothetical protein